MDFAKATKDLFLKEGMRTRQLSWSIVTWMTLIGLITLLLCSGVHSATWTSGNTYGQLIGCTWTER